MPHSLCAPLADTVSVVLKLEAQPGLVFLDLGNACYAHAHFLPAVPLEEGYRDGVEPAFRLIRPVLSWAPWVPSLSTTLWLPMNSRLPSSERVVKA
jgi:hypothetical protein